MDSSASLQDKVFEYNRAGLQSAGRLAIPSGLQRRLFIVGLLLADMLMLAAAIIGAFVIRFEFSLPVFYDPESLPYSFYFALSLGILPFWIGLYWVFGLYNWQILLGGMKEYAGIFKACLTGVILIAVAEFFLEGFVARGWVGLFGILSFLLVGGGRFASRRIGYALRRSGYLTSAALIVGVNPEAAALGEQLLAWPTSGLSLLGFVGDEVEAGTPMCGRLAVVGGLAGLDELVARHQIEDLIIASSAVSREALVDIFKRFGVASPVRLHLSSGLFEVITTGLDVKEIAYVSLINVNRVRLTGTDLVLKTVLDYSAAGLALLLASPLLLLIATLIKIDSPGPVLYRRRVMGLNGRQFEAFKFRTMHVDGDSLLTTSPGLLDELATMHKIKGDPRITRVGQFLRKYSLDELPQLLNVLRREMSLVGPRMISPPELENYGQWATNLLTVRPGITGLWQVSGRSDVPYEDRVRLDMFYIRNYSLWLDLHLMLRTIPVVFSGKGAY